MLENKPVRNSLIIAGVVIAITASFLIVNNVRTKKTEETNLSQVMQAIPNDKKPETAEETVRNESPASTKNVIEIKEKMFISQVNDVYVNPEDYLGKTIKLEGIFKEEQTYEKSYCFVLRYGPGCCGYDGNVGFEVAWGKEDKKKEKTYPSNDSWVEATGELKTYEEDGYTQYLYLDLVSLNVLNKRGIETVMQ
jgi:uncharacterized membrane protein YcgQ (UPF0703/DUF1980 family)